MKRCLRCVTKMIVILAIAVVVLLGWNLRPPEIPEPQLFHPAAQAGPGWSFRLRVVTWNVLSLRWITPRRHQRLEAVAQEAARLQPDIIGFQEAFVAADRKMLLDSLRTAGLTHSQYFPSGLVGSGLLLVSRYPIEANGFMRYASNGRPEALHHGDWWAGKGLSLSTLRLPGGTVLYLGNTHFHARYRENRYHETQLAQAAQLIPWVVRVRETRCPAIWMGDWNSPLDSDVLAPLQEAGGWSILTTESPRIDHIFSSGDGWDWHVVSQGKSNGFLEGEPRVSWSDHSALWVEVEVSRAAP